MTRAIERHRNILDYTLSSLARRKGKLVSLVSLYSLVVALAASVLLFASALRREARFLLADAPDIVVQRMSAGRHDLIPLTAGQAIQAIPGVVSVVPRLWGYYFDPAVGANYTLVVPPQEGRGAGEIAIGAGVARARRIEIGDHLSFRSYRGEILMYAVTDLLSPESELLTADLILMAEGDFRNLFNLPPTHAVDLAVRVANGREVPTVAAKIAERLPDSRPILKAEIHRTYDAIFDRRGGMTILFLLPALFSFLVFAWDRATGLSSEERREIGVLKAVGWDAGDVLLYKFWEGACLSLTALVLGTLLAWVHIAFFSAGLFEALLKGWAVIYPEFRLRPEPDTGLFASLFFLTVVPYTAATIAPGWRAAVTDPDGVLRA